jgi:hypothetical protein
VTPPARRVAGCGEQNAAGTPEMPALFPYSPGMMAGN